MVRIVQRWSHHLIIFMASTFKQLLSTSLPSRACINHSWNRQSSLKVLCLLFQIEIHTHIILAFLNKVLSIWFGRSGSNTIAFYKKRVRIYHCVSKCVVFIVIAPLSLSSAAPSVFPWWCWIGDDFAFCSANSLLVCWVWYFFYLCELWVNRVLGSLIALCIILLNITTCVVPLCRLRKIDTPSDYTRLALCSLPTLKNIYIVCIVSV